MLSPSTVTLPRWDFADMFADVNDRAFVAAREGLGADVGRLVALYDHHRVSDSPIHDEIGDVVSAFEEVLDATNTVSAEATRLRAFVMSFVAVNSLDDDAQRAASVLQQLDATLRQLSARFTSWVAAIGPETIIAASTSAADHAGPLRVLSVRASHQMTPEREELYAELAVTGSSAWARLHADVTSQLTATVHTHGGDDRVLPMAAVRGLATDPDVAVRRAAFDAELAAWPGVAVPLAAALNAIKGEAIAVNRGRSWTDPLEASLFSNNVDRATFDAMSDAVSDSLIDVRRWMKSKALRHGHAGALPWWELFAPDPIARAVSWPVGCDTVDVAFSGYSPELVSVLRRGLRDRWIDAEPRPGKQGGAFCMSVAGDRSGVLLNWSGSLDSVGTLAHELGHAYHNVQLADRTSMQRQLPMALAETASIFCETLVTEAGLAGASDDERLVLLDGELRTATQLLADIRSRVLFETAVFERRASGTLSPAELCSMMTDAQQQSYGDGLDQSTAHPYMWAVKPHYYGSHFYNWPYTFGYLFGLGLYACYRRDPDRFRSGYDSLLGAVALEPATDLAARFGFDITKRDFWEASIDVLRARITTYEALVEGR